MTFVSATQILFQIHFACWLIKLKVTIKSSYNIVCTLELIIFFHQPFFAKSRKIFIYLKGEYLHLLKRKCPQNNINFFFSNFKRWLDKTPPTSPFLQCVPKCSGSVAANPCTKVTVSVSGFLSIELKDLADCCTDMVFFYIVALHRS